MTRIVFMGTPEFGVPVLTALAQCHEVLAVVTQPERPAGRGQKVVAVPPVKAAALELGLRVLQSASLRRDAAVKEALRALQADLFVIAAFGQILRVDVLAMPRRGVIGVHASLLPRWRGAAPIAAAILNGDERTGISLMLTDQGMDTGAVIARASLAIAADDTTASLEARLAEQGACLLLETIAPWLSGTLHAQVQDDALATEAPPLRKEQGAINWHRSALAIDRQIRAMTPWPGAYCGCGSGYLKIWRAHPLPDWVGDVPPGYVLEHDREVAVATGRGLLVLDELQLAGKKSMAAGQFARGRRGFVCSILGSICTDQESGNDG
jgi:methionyl-tRNA formyltransferase